VDGVLDSIVALGEMLGAADAARALVDDARRRRAAGSDAVADLPRPGVVVVEWTDPPYAAGHWVPELAAIAGGRELLGRRGAPSFRTTWERIRGLAPEVVVIAPCGYDLERTRAHAPPERVATWLAGTPALRERRVWAIDANAYLARPGPRIVEGAELLAGILHPGRVPVPATAAAPVAA
jgi:iron complex transport system substrate-binding protein